MGIRFSPDNNYVMTVGGDDRSTMQWKVLAIANDDVVVDKPMIADYQVYRPPKRDAAGDPGPIVSGVSVCDGSPAASYWCGGGNCTHDPLAAARTCIAC